MANMTKVKTSHVSKKDLLFLKLIRISPSSSICLSGAGLCSTGPRGPWQGSSSQANAASWCRSWRPGEDAGPRGEAAVTEAVAVAVASRRLLNTAELWRESGGWEGDMARLGARPGRGQLYTDNRWRLRGNQTICRVIRVVYLTDYMVISRDKRRKGLLLRLLPIFLCYLRK